MASVAEVTRTIHDARGYQSNAINASREDLKRKKGALVVVPTGGGKTLIAGKTVDLELEDQPDARILFLQHTGELLAQNFEAISSEIAHRGTLVSIVKAKHNDWDGQVVFACTPTLRRKSRREQMPFITHLFVDEGHRLGTATCKAVVAHLRAANPDLKIITYTATPNRSDGQTLEYAVGEGCSYQITYAELIDLGVLVPPHTYTIDLGLNAQIEALPKHHGDYDMETIGILLNREVHNEAVFEHWNEKAAERQTIGFCPTVQHAQALAATFRSHGVIAEAIWGDMNEDLRHEILERFEDGTIQVIFNCMVLIEGYDSPRTSCIIILRPMIEEITFLQSVGRGLRSLDPASYPDETKIDCVILDFTGAAARHGTLELRIQEEREAKLRSNTEAKPDLDNVIDMRPAKRKLRDFTMREINLVSAVKQPFVFTDTVCENAIAHNNYAWAGAFYYNDQWYALSRVHNESVRLLAKGDRLDVVTAIDVFLRNDSSGRMPKDIREMPPTDIQIADLKKFLIDPAEILTHYEALCRLSVLRARHQIRSILTSQQPADFKMAA